MSFYKAKIDDGEVCYIMADNRREVLDRLKDHNVITLERITKLEFYSANIGFLGGFTKWRKLYGISVNVVEVILVMNLRSV